MNLDTIITQIKTLAPAFVGNVAGAAEYANSVANQVWLSLPAAYVIIGDLSAEENTSQTDLRQIVTREIGVVIVVDNSVDRRGQTAITTIYALEMQLHKALLNWRPDWDPNNVSTNYEARGFRLVSGSLLESDRAQLRYEITYALDTMLTGNDGWLIPSVPLVQVQGTITDPEDSFDISVPFQVNYPIS